MCTRTCNNETGQIPRNTTNELFASSMCWDELPPIHAHSRLWRLHVRVFVPVQSGEFIFQSHGRSITTTMPWCVLSSQNIPMGHRQGAAKLLTNHWLLCCMRQIKEWSTQKSQSHGWCMEGVCLIRVGCLFLGILTSCLTLWLHCWRFDSKSIQQRFFN